MPKFKVTQTLHRKFSVTRTIEVEAANEDEALSWRHSPLTGFDTFTVISEGLLREGISDARVEWDFDKPPSTKNIEPVLPSVEDRILEFARQLAGEGVTPSKIEAGLHDAWVSFDGRPC